MVFSQTHVTKSVTISPRIFSRILITVLPTKYVIVTYECLMYMPSVSMYIVAKITISMTANP